MAPVRLILASGSPRRRDLLAEAGYAFEVVPPRESAECGICSTGGPAALVVELAMNKALDVMAQLRDARWLSGDALLLACDTVAECGGQILGKPRDEPHARDMLLRLRGSVHRVYSGLCLWQPLAAVPERAEPRVRVATSELRMDAISDESLEEYLASGLWEGKAGAFGYQDRAGWLHLASGSETNVVGLPMELLAEMLAPWGVAPP